jgi:YD repeat-containing protein
MSATAPPHCIAHAPFALTPKHMKPSLLLLAALAACSTAPTVPPAHGEALNLTLINASKDALSDIALGVRYPDGRLYWVTGIDELQPQERRTVFFMIVDDPGLIRIDYTGFAGSKHEKTSKAALFPGAPLHDENSVTIRDEEAVVELNGTKAKAQFYDPDGNLTTTTGEGDGPRTYTYGPDGTLRTITDPNGKPTTATTMPSSSAPAAAK